jgi:hypothetical protein
LVIVSFILLKLLLLLTSHGLRQFQTRSGRLHLNEVGHQGAGNTIVHDHPKAAPDRILVQGILESGAPASISFRTVNSTIYGVGICWIISETEGEIEVTTPEMLGQLRRPGWTLKIKNGNGEAKDGEFSIPEEDRVFSWGQCRATL